MQSRSSVTELQGSEAQPYRQAVLGSREYQDFKQRLQRQVPRVFTPQDDLLEVIDISVEGEDKTVLARIPLEGGAGNSTFVTLFQPDTTIIGETLSVLCTQARDDNIAAVVEQNGIALLDAVITSTGTILKGTLTRTTGEKVVLDGFTEEQMFSLGDDLGLEEARSFRRCLIKCFQGKGLTPANAIMIAAGIAATCVASRFACAIIAGLAFGVAYTVVVFCTGRCW